MTELVATALARPPGLVDASLNLSGGEVVGVVGPNGAGKTTLIRALAGLTVGPGTVLLDGRDLQSLSLPDRADRIAYLPAERTVGWPLLARDVVALGLRRDDPTAIAQALVATDSAAFADRRVDTLSTGERARVLLARAIVGSADVLLLDEPVANLDIRHQLQILDMCRIEAAAGATVLIALHDLTLAARACDRIILMAAGRVITAGTPPEVLTVARLRDVFGIQRGPDGWERG